jgi:hypothetical protein
MEYVDYALIFPSGERAMEQTEATSQLPIIMLAIALICFLVSRGVIVLPAMRLPPRIWSLLFYMRGRWWRVKNTLRYVYRGLKHEIGVQWHSGRKAIRGNPKTTDIAKLMSVLIRDTLEQEVKKGGMNEKNVRDWLERFSIVKGLEQLRPYHSTPKLSKTRGAALKTEIKKRLGNGEYATQAKLPVEPWKNKEGKSTSTGKRLKLKLKTI